MAIVTWNTRGVRSHRAELQLLLRSYSPLAICLQETKLRPQDPFALHPYTPVRCDLLPEEGSPAHGGVMILTRDNVFSRPLSLTTTLQAVAVHLTLPGFSFCLCTIYVPPSCSLAAADLNNLVSQLPAPFLLVGDFNAHHPRWGSSRACARGTLLSDVFDHFNLVVLNTGEPTFISDSTASLSHLDLSVCSPQLAHRFQWNVVSDTHSSDHCPCVLTLLSPPACPYLAAGKGELGFIYGGRGPPGSPVCYHRPHGRAF